LHGCASCVCMGFTCAGRLGTRATPLHATSYLRSAVEWPIRLLPAPKERRGPTQPLLRCAREASSGQAGRRAPQRRVRVPQAPDGEQRRQTKR
jgi:hypothetical protein